MWMTVVYRNIRLGDEAQKIGEHPKVSALSWSHALNDRDALRARIAELEQQLVTEAARTAAEKLRADQMTEQHRMQCAMRQQLEQQLQAKCLVQISEPVAQRVDPAKAAEAICDLSDALQMFVGTDATHSLCVHESMDAMGRVKGTWSKAAEVNARATLEIHAATIEAQAKQAEALQTARNGGCGCCSNACADRADGCRFVHENPSAADMAAAQAKQGGA